MSAAITVEISALNKFSQVLDQFVSETHATLQTVGDEYKAFADLVEQQQERVNESLSKTQDPKWIDIWKDLSTAILGVVVAFFQFKEALATLSLGPLGLGLIGLGVALLHLSSGLDQLAEKFPGLRSEIEAFQRVLYEPFGILRAASEAAGDLARRVGDIWNGASEGVSKWITDTYKAVTEGADKTEEKVRQMQDRLAEMTEQHINGLIQIKDKNSEAGAELIRRATEELNRFESVLEIELANAKDGTAYKAEIEKTLEVIRKQIENWKKNSPLTNIEIPYAIELWPDDSLETVNERVKEGLRIIKDGSEKAISAWAMENPIAAEYIVTFTGVEDNIKEILKSALAAAKQTSEAFRQIPLQFASNGGTEEIIAMMVEAETATESFGKSLGVLSAALGIPLPNLLALVRSQKDLQTNTQSAGAAIASTAKEIGGALVPAMNQAESAAGGVGAAVLGIAANADQSTQKVGGFFKRLADNANDAAEDAGETWREELQCIIPDIDNMANAFSAAADFAGVFSDRWGQALSSVASGIGSISNGLASIAKGGILNGLTGGLGINSRNSESHADIFNERVVPI